MKVLYFTKNSSNIFSEILVLCNSPEVRLLDYVLLLHATVMSMILKGLKGRNNDLVSILAYCSLMTQYFCEAAPWLVLIGKF